MRKSNIIKATKILEVGTIKTMKLFENKRIYIINPEQYKKNKIVLREVNASSGFYQMCEILHLKAVWQDCEIPDKFTFKFRKKFYL